MKVYTILCLPIGPDGPIDKGRVYATRWAARERFEAMVNAFIGELGRVPSKHSDEAVTSIWNVDGVEFSLRLLELELIGE